MKITSTSKLSNIITFKEFSKIWLTKYAIPNCTPPVIKCYEYNLNNWLNPYFGTYKLKDISPIIITNFIILLKESTTKYKFRKNKKLSAGSIKKIYGMLRTILQIAFQNDIIVSNPCLKVKLKLKNFPNENRLHYWTPEEYKNAITILHKEKSDNKYVIEFALKTGLRRSEIFGLKWEDIDLDTNSLFVNKTRQKNPNKNYQMQVMSCKNNSSIREIAIPISLSHSIRNYFIKYNNNEFIFENIDYDSLTAWFRRWQRKNGIKQIRFHDLRHTHATLLLYKGIDIKTISERLGHSCISTTMNVYTHVVKELDRTASDAIDKL